MDEDIDALLEAAFDKKGVSDYVFWIVSGNRHFYLFFIPIVLCYSMLGRVVLNSSFYSSCRAK